MARTPRHTILLMRHPETPANTEHFFSGRLDIDITADGEEMRDRAVRAGVAFCPDRIWTSPLRRCHCIADPVASRLGLQSVSNENLVEIDFGSLEGTAFSSGWVSGGAFPWPIGEDGLSRPAEGGESFEHAFARAESLFEQLRTLEGRTLCVTHGGMLRVIMGALYGMPKDRFWYMRIDNVSSVVITFDGKRFMLDSFGLTPEEVYSRYAMEGGTEEGSRPSHGEESHR